MNKRIKHHLLDNFIYHIKFASEDIDFGMSKEKTILEYKYDYVACTYLEKAVHILNDDINFTKYLLPSTKLKYVDIFDNHKPLYDCKAVFIKD